MTPLKNRLLAHVAVSREMLMCLAVVGVVVLLVLGAAVVFEGLAQVFPQAQVPPP